VTKQELVTESEWLITQMLDESDQKYHGDCGCGNDKNVKDKL
jgi:hypothetical protein